MEQSNVSNAACMCDRSSRYSCFSAYVGKRQQRVGDKRVGSACWRVVTAANTMLHALKSFLTFRVCVCHWVTIVFSPSMPSSESLIRLHCSPLLLSGFNPYRSALGLQEWSLYSQITCTKTGSELTCRKSPLCFSLFFGFNPFWWALGLGKEVSTRK